MVQLILNTYLKQWGVSFGIYSTCIFKLFQWHQVNIYNPVIVKHKIQLEKKEGRGFSLWIDWIIKSGRNILEQSQTWMAVCCWL